jgi:4-alpha-glucanotransferase
LPGGHGIGDLGPEAYRFVDFLTAARQGVWQILPLGPTGYGNSPFATRSAFAGNPLLISLEQLEREGLLSAVGDIPSGHVSDRVDFARVADTKLTALRHAAEAFARDADNAQRTSFDAFCAENELWLEDYALFMAAHERSGPRSWLEWEPKLAARDEGTLRELSRSAEAEVQFRRVMQYLFWRQWTALRAYANARGVRIVGDIPIFVALDSADVWSHRGEFWLDEEGRPTVVSGVPPDYFSPTGQRWGNPLYRWEVMAANGYQWWIERFRHLLRLVDVIRIDHFRGFQANWEIPAHHETAVEGRWAPGPGRDVFLAGRAAMGVLPIIVEDLGLITEDVIALREELGYPGMKVLHFAFDAGPANPFLPHWYEQNLVVYTGTHDNDTTVGWFQTRAESERGDIQRYLRSDGHEIAWDLIRLALSSVADTAIVPVQDVLGLGSAARMNYPGRAEGNWAWRLLPDQLKDGHAERLRELTELYGRAWESGFASP